MKVAYCGFDFFSACLDVIFQAGHEVLAVFSASCEPPIPANRNICEFCETHGIHHISAPIDTQMIHQLESQRCEVLITAAYDFKIPDLVATGIKGINIHPTLLPVGRGIWPLPWTILTDQVNSGVSIHKITQQMDAGDLLLQEKLKIDPEETLETLSAKVQILAKQMLPRVLQDLDTLWDQAHPQSGEAVTWPNPDRGQRTIDWHRSVREIKRLNRAYGKAGCYARFDGQDWVVYGLAGWEQAHSYAIGSIVHKTSTEMIVAASDGLVSLLYFEPDRSKPGKI